jgi:hypothetical protein
VLVEHGPGLAVRRRLADGREADLVVGVQVQADQGGLRAPGTCTYQAIVINHASCVVAAPYGAADKVASPHSWRPPP